MRTAWTRTSALRRDGSCRAISAAIQSADRIADDGHVVEAESLQEIDVHRGESGNGVQAFGPVGEPETRVGRRDDPCRMGSGQELGKAGDRLRTGSTVEDQERPALAALGDSEVDVADRRLGQVIGGGVHGLPSWNRFTVSLYQHIELSKLI